MSAQSAIFNPSQTTSAASGDGFSVPRLTTTGRLAITFTAADKGMMVYDTTLNNLFIWNGSAWESVPASGDAGADGSVQYNDNGVVSGAANLQYNKASGYTSLRSGSALRAYVADNSVYSTISDQGAAGGLTIDNLNADGISLKIGGVNAYVLNAGTANWYDGAGGTRMTLNSTGLGVGASPATRLHISNTGDVYARIATTSVSKAGVQFSANGVVRSHLLYDDGAGTTYLTTGTSFGGSGQALAIQSGTSLSIYTNNQLATAQFTVDTSGNVGIAVTPSAWSSYKALQVGSIGSLSSVTGATIVGNNWFYDGASKYITTAASTIYEQGAGTHAWYSAASGPAGTAVSFGSAKMTLDASGRLIINSLTFLPPTLNTNGDLNFIATSNTNVRFSYRGTDGVTRVANITLA